MFEHLLYVSPALINSIWPYQCHTDFLMELCSWMSTKEARHMLWKTARWLLFIPIMANSIPAPQPFTKTSAISLATIVIVSLSHMLHQRWYCFSNLDISYIDLYLVSHIMSAQTVSQVDCADALASSCYQGWSVLWDSYICCWAEGGCGIRSFSPTRWKPYLEMEKLLISGLSFNWNMNFLYLSLPL